MRGMLQRQQQLDASSSCSSSGRCQPTVSRAARRIVASSRRSDGARTVSPVASLVLAAVRSSSISDNGDYKEKEDDDNYSELPTKFELMQRPDKQKPLVRVRLSVHYRVHSRQILCIGGSQIPLGWSFLSIAKVPMTWNSGDIWTCEVDLQAGQRIEHKYVILEEQDWTKIENEDAQGVVEITYRQGSTPGKPPDVQVIQKQMAIVAWQPGPNRIVQVPTEEELAQLKPGDVIERIPPRPGQRQSDGQRGDKAQKLDPFEGTWEVLRTDEEGKPFLDRHDVWGWVPAAGTRPADNLKGFNFVQGQQQQ